MTSRLFARRPSTRLWWTKERVLLGLKNFYSDFHLVPTSQTVYQDHKAFTGVIRNGRASNWGWESKYPAYASIANYFAGMREAWRAVAEKYPELDIEVDRGHEDWTSDEDNRILNSVGIIPRTEVSQLTKRTGPAIKRRLYDLGIGAYNRWGWTINHAARVLHLRNDVISKYVVGRQLPFLQGNKCIYIDPADLPLVIKEYDWTRKRHSPELVSAIQHSLALRFCCLALGYDWAKVCYHRIQPLRNFRTGAARRVRQLPLSTNPNPRIKRGVWVKVDSTFTHKRKALAGRIGKVEAVKWTSNWFLSRTASRQKQSATSSTWTAIVVFTKQTKHGHPERNTIKYGVPISALTITKRPKIPPRPKLRIGSFVQLTATYGPTGAVKQRIGKLVALNYAKPLQQPRRKKSAKAKNLRWMATIEFDKVHSAGDPKIPTVQYKVPATLIKVVPRSLVPPRPNLQHGDTVAIQTVPPREGSVINIHLSVYAGKPKRRRPQPQWLVKVRCKKLRRNKASRPTSTIDYFFPVSLLHLTTRP